MREQVINVEPQKVITRDNVTVTVDAVIYYRVVDPVRAKFEVQNFGLAATTLAQTNLRNLIGDKTLDETLIARDMINTNLRAVLDEATNTWGVKVTRVEVQKIDPPVDITEAMSRQMKAERDKRAVDPRVRGHAAERDPEGRGVQAGGEILQAEGDAQARITRAQAEAKAIEMVSNAAEQFFQERAALSKQLDVLQNTLSQNVEVRHPRQRRPRDRSRSRYPDGAFAGADPAQRPEDGAADGGVAPQDRRRLRRVRRGPAGRETPWRSRERSAPSRMRARPSRATRSAIPACVTSTSISPPSTSTPPGDSPSSTA